MKRIVFGKSVQGASHKRVGMECQDNYRQVECDNGTVILAVADGHGSKDCPYSKTGSKIAVNVFCEVMEEFYRKNTDNLEMLLTYLNREGDTKVAQAFDAEWKRRVLERHTRKKRVVPRRNDGNKDEEGIYKLYGSTLVGLMITPLFLFAFQLGDGDIIYVDNNGIDRVLRSERILGIETHSLCMANSWKRAISNVRRLERDLISPSMFILSTDGFANSYLNEQEFDKTLTGYFEMITQHGAEVIKANLKNWLVETSEMGCGDDITLLVAYFSNAIPV